MSAPIFRKRTTPAGSATSRSGKTRKGGAICRRVVQRGPFPGGLNCPSSLRSETTPAWPWRERRPTEARYRTFFARSWWGGAAVLAERNRPVPGSRGGYFRPPGVGPLCTTLRAAALSRGWAHGGAALPSWPSGIIRFRAVARGASGRLGLARSAPPYGLRRAFCANHFAACCVKAARLSGIRNPASGAFFTRTASGGCGRVPPTQPGFCPPESGIGKNTGL